MFKSLNSVALPVSNIEKARDWYSTVLNTKPVMDSPIVVIFSIGDYTLMLNPAAREIVAESEKPLVYWDVDDADEAYKRLLELGAAKHTDVSISVGNNRIARVYDPFGNVLGITSKPSEKTKTLEDKPSESALTVAFCRALSAHDDREMFNCKDNIAELFLNDDAKKTLDNPASRDWLFKNMMTPGVYEFFIARTKYIDSVFVNAVESGFLQIVFLGAGYDSRAYRFADRLGSTKVFELDAAPTQRRKIERLRHGNIAHPPQLTYVQMNFEKDSFADVLTQAGFDKTLKTLFVWEGVSYYLTPQAVNDTFDFIRNNSPSGSVICFDYIPDAPDLNERYGTAIALKNMKSLYEAETARFTIDEGTIEDFLAPRGFVLLEHLSPEEISEKYFTASDGARAANITAMFCFVRAEVH